MNIKVSVIMSEYNTEEEILEQSIKSILEQTFKNFEFIIVNDGDSNNLKNIVNKLNDERITLIENKKNIGLPKSLNKAIDKSKGKYLIRMDSDDISHPKRIEKLVNFIESNPHFSVVGSSINLLTESDEKIEKISSGEITKHDLMNKRAPVHPSVIMKTEDIRNIGGYKTDNVSRCEDFVLWSELLLNQYKIFIIEDILLDYRVTINDYKKRKFSTRKDEIKNRFKYYSLMGASPMQYLSIFKSIIASLVPGKVMAYYHRHG